MIYAVLFTHWVADFFAQTDKMAKGKSKSNRWLLYHIAAYTAVLMIFGPVYAVANGAIHMVVDYFTSRITSKLWAHGRVHDFFVVIGFDQLVHTAVLIATMPLIWGRR